MSAHARSRSAVIVLAAASLAVLGEAASGRPALALLPPLAILLTFARSLPRRWLLLGLGLVGLLGIGRLHVRSAETGWESRAPALLAAKLDQVDDRAQRLFAELQGLAAHAARLDAGRGPASASDPELFARLEQLAQRGPEDVSLALRAPGLDPWCWAGSPLELVPGGPWQPVDRDVLAFEGTLSTVLVAFAKSPGAQGGGWATAELAVATRRNIRNEFLHDYERLTDEDPELEIRYEDPRGPRNVSAAWPPLPPGTQSATREIRSPGGRLIATVRAAALRPERAAESLRARYRGLASALALVLLLTVLAARPTPLRLALLATLARGAMLGLGLPLEFLVGAERSAAYLSGTPGWLAGLGAFRGLVASPLDLLLTGAWLACVTAALLSATGARPRARSLPRTLAADVVAAPILLLVFRGIERIAVGATVDLSAFSLVPDSLTTVTLQAALLLALATGLFALTALFARTPPPLSAPALLARGLTWLGLGVILALRQPHDSLGMPLVPALLLALTAALAGSAWTSWRPRLAAQSPERRAALAVGLVAFLAGLLYLTLAHYADASLRRSVEYEHAPVVLRQPQWRDYVLRAARRTIDETGLPAIAPSGPAHPGVEELAFALWSTTDLAAFGFSSAVEVQDADGRIVSRFALNLPSLAAPQRSLPASTDWEISRERLTVASAEREVVHAQRLLVSEGRVLGAIHVYVGDDYWNLPFLKGRDPYSTLFRSTQRSRRPLQPLQLLVFGSGLQPLFSSAERPPSLDPEIARRARAAAPGIWASLTVDGQPHEAFVFADGPTTFAIAYRPLEPGRLLADLVEAMSGFALLAVALLAAWVLLRTARRRPTLSLGSVVAAVRERFALRLFWAFIAVAVVPLVVLQGLIGRAVADRLRSESDLQALDLAAVARKAVEDYAVFQGSEGDGPEPVSDAVLVWVASLTGTDLDVFAEGQLLASSKRELYASGLLSPRLAGPVYAALALEGRGSAIETERIGDFAYRVVSIPLRFRSGPLHILSIPLASREREVAAVVDDLARTMRVTAALFLLAAAGLSLSMSRRISGPIRDLTRATGRIAAGDLEARVTASTRDELATLVSSFNRMAGELERQRRDLERTNRLAAWTEMARQVAHEVKNPLTPIQLSAEHLRRVHGDPAVDFTKTLRTCTDVILSQVENLRQIVTEFSSFARPPAPTLEALDLAGLIRETTRPYAAVLSPDIRLELELGDEAVPLRGDRRLLERAVVNLIENALQAVGERGRVVVRLRVERSGWRRIEVEDSGPGVEPEIRGRIFEPFFSTKAAGSGLGLALVRRIAEDHGGSAELEAVPGQPTRALLRLPPDPASPPQPGPQG